MIDVRAWGDRCFVEFAASEEIEAVLPQRREFPKKAEAFMGTQAGSG